MRFQSVGRLARFLLLACLALPTLLAGCGGGGGGAAAPPSPYAGRYNGTVTTQNDNVTRPVTFIIDANGIVSTTVMINGVNQTFSAPLGNVDADGNFRTEVTTPVRVIFTGTIKPDAVTGVMRIDGSFFVPSSGLRGTYTAVRVAAP